MPARSGARIGCGSNGLNQTAGMGMLRELAELTGLSARVSAALADTYKGPWIHAPGGVFADHAWLAAGVKRTACDEILSDLETAGLASVNHQLVA